MEIRNATQDEAAVIAELYGLDLWAFRSKVALTEGDYEEGEPDVRYHWSP
jgi:hypothetical protein